MHCNRSIIHSPSWMGNFAIKLIKSDKSQMLCWTTWQWQCNILQLIKSFLSSAIVQIALQLSLIRLWKVGRHDTVTQHPSISTLVALNAKQFKPWTCVAGNANTYYGIWRFHFSSSKLHQVIQASVILASCPGGKRRVQTLLEGVRAASKPLDQDSLKCTSGHCSAELVSVSVSVSVSVFLTRGCTAPLCVHSVAASVLVPKPFCWNLLRALSWTLLIKSHKYRYK